jgi:hypothetical protein
LSVEKAPFILDRRRRSMREWAVLRMAFLVGLPVLLTCVDDEEEADFCVECGSETGFDVVFLRLLGD